MQGWYTCIYKKDHTRGILHKDTAVQWCSKSIVSLCKRPINDFYGGKNINPPYSWYLERRKGINFTLIWKLYHHLQYFRTKLICWYMYDNISKDLLRIMCDLNLEKKEQLQKMCILYTSFSDILLPSCRNCRVICIQGAYC